MPRPLTVTVIGATGLVGGHLVRRLLRRDEVATVNVHARSDRPSSLPAKVNWRPFPQLDYFADAYTRAGMLERMSEVIAEGLGAGDVFLSCLGTTRRQAGSAARFRFVDYAVNAAFARAASEAGYSGYGLVSSVGADAGSPFLYTRVKGELEAYVGGLGFERIRIYRPGLLQGERRERRFGESLMARVTSVAGKVFPSAAGASFASIEASAVAQAMVTGVFDHEEGLKVLANSGIQRLTSYE